MAEVHPARLKQGARADAGANPDLRGEQDAAAEIDLIVGRILKLLRRAGVDGQAEARADEELVTESRRQAYCRIVGLPLSVGGAASPSA